jgi:tetratricopeptide (TPR) repeat protein
MDRPHFFPFSARVARVVLLALVVAVRGPVALAQPVPASADAIRQADALYFVGRAEEAHDLLLAYLESHPSDYEALWRAVRAAVVLELVDEENGAPARWLDPAIGLGDRAGAQRPDGVEGLYWRGAAEGRRALYAGNSYAAELAQRVYDNAHAVLALDPLHGGAHNLLGKLSYEIMVLSRVERFLARTISNSPALRDASWERAELHLRRATELWPDQVLFHLDLARLYERRGRKEEARETLRRVVAMPSLHPADENLKADARRLLRAIGS